MALKMHSSFLLSIKFNNSRQELFCDGLASKVSVGGVQLSQPRLHSLDSVLLNTWDAEGRHFSAIAILSSTYPYLSELFNQLQRFTITVHFGSCRRTVISRDNDVSNLDIIAFEYRIWVPVVSHVNRSSSTYTDTLALQIQRSYSSIHPVFCYDASITTVLGRMGTNIWLNMAILIGRPKGY
jgi:hypothetical protein